MANLDHICPSTTEALASAIFLACACPNYALVVMHGARSWEIDDRGSIALPQEPSQLTIPIGHDRRGAPYVATEDGSEQRDQLISLSDEEDYLACAWACPNPDSPLLGLGIDLVSTSSFTPDRRERRSVQHMFSPREHDLVASKLDADPALGYAIAFGAKEASFKAMAAPLRRWYEQRGDHLPLDLRDFALVSPDEADGRGRKGAGQAAMDRLGIRCIKVHYTRIEDLALVVACALGTRS